MLVKKLKGRKSVFDVEFEQVVGSKVTMKKSCQLQRMDGLLKNNRKQTVVTLVILGVAHQYILLPIGGQQQVEELDLVVHSGGEGLLRSPTSSLPL
jgi:hypothetical protein